MNVFEKLIASLDGMLESLRADQELEPQPPTEPAPAVRNRPVGGIGVAPTPQYTADTINPCPVCLRRCDFEVCACVDGCVGDGDHLRRLMDKGKGPRT